MVLEGVQGFPRWLRRWSALDAVCAPCRSSALMRWPQGRDRSQKFSMDFDGSSRVHGSRVALGSGVDLVLGQYDGRGDLAQHSTLGMISSIIEKPKAPSGRPGSERRHSQRIDAGWARRDSMWRIDRICLFSDSFKVRGRSQRVRALSDPVRSTRTQRRTGEARGC
jgi:hypothetical protein